MFSALDLTNIYSIKAATFINKEYIQRIAQLPEPIRSSIYNFEFYSWQPSVIVAIPNGDFAAPSAAALIDGLVIDKGAAVHQFDVVKSAIELPSVVERPLSHLARAQRVEPLSPAEWLHLKGNERAKADRCLAEAVYFEARSEPVHGQIAVAQVVINRVFTGYYPRDVCAVVYQNAKRHLGCQFSFACVSKRKAITDSGAWARARHIAELTLDGELYEAEVGTATHYHTIYVRPNWEWEMRKIARYGMHEFYRPYAWGSGTADPVWSSAALATSKDQ